MGRLDRWSRLTFTGIDRASRLFALAATGLGLLACWVIALNSDPVTAVSRHWFYVPVVFAAVRFGVRGAVAAGAIAGVLAGPFAGGLSTMDTAIGIWGTRAAFFLGVGTVVGILVTMLRRSLEGDIELARREAELAGQQATFIQTISHEFRTPLTILRGGILTLDRQKERVDVALQPLIGGMVRAERRLDEMVSVVLATVESADVSRRLETEAVSLAAVAADVVSELASRNGPERVHMQLHDPDLVVTVPAYLRLILHTIIDNALRFSPDGSPVELSSMTTDDAVCIVVRDHGEGMDGDLLEIAFDPFTQGDPSAQRARGGLGLGLFTARRLVERLGGTIAMAPQDEGLAVEIVLPQRRETDEASPGRLSVTTPGDGWTARA